MLVPGKTDGPRGESRAGQGAASRRLRAGLATLGVFVLAFAAVHGSLNLRGNRPQGAAGRPTAAVDRHPDQRAGASLSPPLTADGIFARCSPAVVQVEAPEGPQGLTVSKGSGFLVRTDGLVATNYHVIEDASSAYIVADKMLWPVLGVAAADEEADLAILKVGGRIDARPLELAEGGLPPIGSKVYAVGNPEGFANTLSEGLISGHREEGAVAGLNRVAVIQTTTPISRGSSGGPLLGADGKLVGITTYGWRGGQNLNFAVPASHVARLLLRCEGGVPPTPLPLARRRGASPPARPPGPASGGEAEAVKLIRKRLVAGMTATQAAQVIWGAAGEAKCGVGLKWQRTGPYEWVVRYFPYEGDRGPGRTGLRYRLAVQYRNGRVYDWTAEGD